MRMFPLFFLLFIPFVANADCNYDIEAACIGAPGCYWNDEQSTCSPCLASSAVDPQGYYCPQGGTCPSDLDMNDGRCKCPEPFIQMDNEGATEIYTCHAKVTCEDEHGDDTNIQVGIYCGIGDPDGWDTNTGKCKTSNADYYNVQWTESTSSTFSLIKKAISWANTNSPIITTGFDGDLEGHVIYNSGDSPSYENDLNDQYYSKFHIETIPKYIANPGYIQGGLRWDEDSFEIKCVQNKRKCELFNLPNAFAPVDCKNFDHNDNSATDSTACEHPSHTGCEWVSISDTSTNVHKCVNINEVGVPKAQTVTDNYIDYGYVCVHDPNNTATIIGKDNDSGRARWLYNNNKQRFYWDTSDCRCIPAETTGQGLDPNKHCYTIQSDTLWGMVPGNNNNNPEWIVNSTAEHIVFGAPADTHTEYCVKCQEGSYYANFDLNRRIVDKCLSMPTQLGKIRIESAQGYCGGNTTWANAEYLQENPCRLENCPYPGTTTTNNTQIVHPGETAANYCKYGAETKLCDGDGTNCKSFNSISFGGTTLTPGDWTLVDNE